MTNKASIASIMQKGRAEIQAAWVAQLESSASSKDAPDYGMCCEQLWRAADRRGGCQR